MLHRPHVRFEDLQGRKTHFGLGDVRQFSLHWVSWVRHYAGSFRRGVMLRFLDEANGWPLEWDEMRRQRWDLGSGAQSKEYEEAHPEGRATALGYGMGVMAQ